MSDYVFPGNGHGTSVITREGSGDPRADRLAAMITSSAVNVLEGIRRRKPTRMGGTATSTGRRAPNTRAPRLADVRADAQRVMSLLEAWAVMTGADGSQPGDPLRRASEKTLARIAQKHLGLDITEMMGIQAEQRG